MQEILHELSFESKNRREKPFESKLRALSWQFLILGWTLGCSYNVWKCWAHPRWRDFAGMGIKSGPRPQCTVGIRLKSGNTPPVKTNWLENSLS